MLIVGFGSLATLCCWLVLLALWVLALRRLLRCVYVFGAALVLACFVASCLVDVYVRVLNLVGAWLFYLVLIADWFGCLF